jgi:hypothetical protein
MLKIWGAVMPAALLCVVELATGPPASALDQRLEVTNTTRLAIVELYVARPGTSDWEKDVLGEEYLPPGNSMAVSLGDSWGRCRFDFKVVFDDGAELIRRNVNVCDAGKYTITRR